MQDEHRWQGASINDHTVTDQRPEPPPQRDPYFLLWIVYLFFRPRTFFRHFIDNKWPSLLVACAWMFGMARASERFITRGTISGTQNNPILASWSVFWPAVLIGGAISGLLYFYIGGWWYRLRIKWSGDPDPDKVFARRVYLYAAQIIAIPSMVILISTAPMYASPADMADAPFAWWDLLPLLFVPWSFIASFIGVRTVFDTGLIRSLIWFLILPITFIAIALALVIIGTLLIESAPQRPETANPTQHRTPGLNFEYPSNWTIDTHDDYHDNDYHITIDAPQDATITIAAYETESDFKQVLAHSVDAYRTSLSDQTKIRDMTTWYGMYGIGEHHTGNYAGNNYTLIVFERPVDDGVGVEIIIVHRTEDTDLLRPGFELIAKSLNFTP
ncbi:MAG: YIP1 family protein [Phycisphaerales bacterium]|nr:YIP1 family protein [Phycisphaerales bacterium]